MKISKTQSRIFSAIMALSLLLSIGIAFSTTVQAQNQGDRDAQRRRDRDSDRNRNNTDDHRRGSRNWDGYGNYGGSFQLRQTALNAGFNEGLKQGRDDRNQRNRSDFHNRSAYRKATKDYNSRDGDRSLYQRYYREAYENGYGAGAAGN